LEDIRFGEVEGAGRVTKQGLRGGGSYAVADSIRFCELTVAWKVRWLARCKFTFHARLGFAVKIIKLTLLTPKEPYVLGDPDICTPANPPTTNASTLATRTLLPIFI